MEKEGLFTTVVGSWPLANTKEHMEKALSLAERLTERERYFVKAEAFLEGLLEDPGGKFGGAEESYKRTKV